MTAANHNTLFEGSRVTMQFGGITALDQVDISVEPDTVLGLIGPNGAGKTTMFNVITGMYKPTAGQLLFKGAEISGRTPQEIAKMGIIRTFQHPRLWFDISVLDNLLLGMYLQPHPGLLSAIFKRSRLNEDFKRKIGQALDMLSIFDPELVDKHNRKVKELSLVDLRRVEICRAALADPQLMLLDEPAAGMDPSETCQLMEDIEKIRKERSGLGVIIIEHDMEVISGIAQKVVVLNFGEKIAEGAFKELANSPEVCQAYLGVEA